jgi:uncharacterized membrane protein YfcA
MRTVIILLSVSILGAVGWHLGKPGGLVWAWFVSSVGSLVGVYVGWRLANYYLE